MRGLKQAVQGANAQKLTLKEKAKYKFSILNSSLRSLSHIHYKIGWRVSISEAGKAFRRLNLLRENKPMLEKEGFDVVGAISKDVERLLKKGKTKVAKWRVEEAITHANKNWSEYVPDLMNLLYKVEGKSYIDYLKDPDSPALQGIRAKFFLDELTQKFDFSKAKPLHEWLKDCPPDVASVLYVFAELSLDLHSQMPNHLLGKAGTDKNRYDEEVIPLDEWSNKNLCKILIDTGLVKKIYSEEGQEPYEGAARAPLIAAIDPLDGSGNVKTLHIIGNILSLHREEPQSGRDIVAAAIVVYTSFPTLIISYGEGTSIFLKDTVSSKFLLLKDNIKMGDVSASSSYGMGGHIKDKDERYNKYVSLLDDVSKLRTDGSFAGEVLRAALGNSFFGYPELLSNPNGKLRGLEANHGAFLIEQMGGASWDGRTRDENGNFVSMLDIKCKPTDRTPVHIGTKEHIQKLSEMLKQD